MSDLSTSDEHRHEATATCDRCGTSFTKGGVTPEAAQRRAERSVTNHANAAHGGNRSAPFGRDAWHRITAALSTGDVALPTAATEAESARDGFVSYRIEWKAIFAGAILGILWGHEPAVLTLIIGLLAAAFGVDIAGARVKRVPNYVRGWIRQEVHYFVGGVLAGRYLIFYAHDYVGFLDDILPTIPF